MYVYMYIYINMKWSSVILQGCCWSRGKNQSCSKAVPI